MATNEEELQREWRGIVISKLDKLDSELKDMRTDLEAATATAKEVSELRTQLTEVRARFYALELKTTTFRTADQVHDKYVSKEDFAPIKSLVYGAITLGLVTLATALLSLVFNK